MSDLVTPWLDHLQVLFPPRSAVLVGAGTGRGAWVQWLLRSGHGADVTLVEANAEKYAVLQKTVAAAPLTEAVKVLDCVVAAERGEVPFFIASLAAESGVMDPQALRSLWPNLRTLQEQQRSATTVQDLLVRGDADGAVEPLDGGNWLLLDCLPAAALLQSLDTDTLGGVDMLLARVLLDEAADTDAGSAWSGASLRELEETLRGNDLLRLMVQPTRHPDIAHALFARDARASLRRAAATSAQHARQKLNDLQALERRLAGRTRANVDLEQELARARSAQKGLQAELEHERSRAQTLQASLDEQAQAQAALQQQLRQAAQARQALQAQLTAELEKAKRAKEDEAGAKAELQARFNNLQAEQEETAQRQGRIDEELKRAEAQLKLLEELLLNEGSEQSPVSQVAAEGRPRQP